MIYFSNSYSKLPDRFFERVLPAKFKRPELLLYNTQLAFELGIELDASDKEELARIFSGQKILEGSEPMALAYAAHQFGHWVPELGDGRALLLGEVSGQDIQLKGSGQTRFSRRGDGRSALGPVIREYIVSEAMHALGIDTTRALAAVKTGEEVYRQDGPEPGGIFTRVAASHIRVGTFQYFAGSADIEGLKALLDYSINRHYPELLGLNSYSEKAIAFIKAVGEKQASLVSKWLGVGFIHGVMNTDNFSIAGITLDFGPCAFMDEFKKDKVFSSIDQHGRYSYSNQIPIAQWNILRLADALLGLVDENPDKAVRLIEKEIVQTMEIFPLKRHEEFCRKLGIDSTAASSKLIIDKFLTYLEEKELDFTQSFRALPDLYKGESSLYRESKLLEEFIILWKEAEPKIEGLDRVNPFIIPRNHQVQAIIEEVYSGKRDGFLDFVEALKDPFSFDQKKINYTIPPGREERISRTFCGT